MRTEKQLKKQAIAPRSWSWAVGPQELNWRRTPSRWDVVLIVLACFLALGCRHPVSLTWKSLPYGERLLEEEPADSATPLPLSGPAATLGNPIVPESDSHGSDLFTGEFTEDQELTLDKVVTEAMRLHPTLEAAEALALAAREEFPQVTALHDPQFRFLNGPTLFGSNSGNHLWRIQLQQRLPYIGKLTLIGDLADQRAETAKEAWKLARQKVVAIATEAFLEYVRSERMYELVMSQIEIMETELEARKVRAVSATDKAEGEENWELETLELKRTRDEANQTRRRATQKLNTLLKRPAVSPLPLPSVEPLPVELPSLDALIHAALKQHPELAVARTRVKMAETEMALAYKDFYPDLELVGRFDTTSDQFWAPDQASIRPQVGVHLYLPLEQGRRWARVRQTKWEIQQRQAEVRALEEQVCEAIRAVYADLEHSQNQLQTVSQLVSLAERQVVNFKQWVGTDREVSGSKVFAAQKKLSQFQMEQSQEETRLRQQLVELYIRAGYEQPFGQDIPLPERHFAPEEDWGLPRLPNIFPYSKGRLFWP